jgi:transposase
MGAPKKADWREEQHKRAWALKYEGWPQKDIAAALGVSDGAVSQWMKRAREGGGVEALTQQPPPGMRPRLRADQRAQLPGLLVGGAEAHGFRGDVWTAKRVADLIWRHFGALPSRPRQPAAAPPGLESTAAARTCGATRPGGDPAVAGGALADVQKKAVDDGYTMIACMHPDQLRLPLGLRCDGLIDLPVISLWIGKIRGAQSPRLVSWGPEQLDALGLEVRVQGVDILYAGG